MSSVYVPHRERWCVTNTVLSSTSGPHESYVEIDYDNRGDTQISREDLSDLLIRCGAQQVALVDREAQA